MRRPLEKFIDITYLHSSPEFLSLHLSVGGQEADFMHYVIYSSRVGSSLEVEQVVQLQQLGHVQVEQPVAAGPQVSHLLSPHPQKLL